MDLLVIHCISLPPRVYGGPEIEQFFCNGLDTQQHPYFQQLENIKVSAHFLIRRDGELLQFVACDARAWHAGESRFCGRENCNDFSLGIELEGHDDDAFTAEQYTCLVNLTRCLQAQYPRITDSRIVGHQDIAPIRKTDPGSGFNWSLFFRLLANKVANR